MFYTGGKQTYYKDTEGVYKDMLKTITICTFCTGGKQTYYMLKPLQYVCSTQGVNKRIIRTC